MKRDEARFAPPRRHASRVKSRFRASCLLKESQISKSVRVRSDRGKTRTTATQITRRPARVNLRIRRVRRTNGKEYKVQLDRMKSNRNYLIEAETVVISQVSEIPSPPSTSNGNIHTVTSTSARVSILRCRIPVALHRALSERQPRETRAIRVIYNEIQLNPLELPVGELPLVLVCSYFPAL